jgi:hypothetical protein
MDDAIKIINGIIKKKIPKKISPISFEKPFLRPKKTAAEATV